MAKAFILFAIFGALLLVTDAAIYRTTVTTTEVEDDKPTTSRRCSEQIRTTDIGSCQRFITQSMRGGEIALTGDSNPREEMDLQNCCQQLQQIDDDQCKCQAIEEIMRGQQSQFRGQEMQEMMERARTIPQYCRIQRCQFGQPRLF